MITTENIEAYLLDYQEGNLSQFKIKELLDFVALNPEFASDLEFEPLPVDFSIEFPAKASLKKEVAIKPQVFSSLNENNSDLFIVAKIENELTAEEELHFQRALNASPEFESKFQAYIKTIILVDNSLIFEHKKQLRKVGIVLPIYSIRRVLSYSAAASILLFAGYLFLRTSPKMIEDKKSASKKQPKIEKQLPTSPIVDSKEAIQVAKDFIHFKTSKYLALDTVLVKKKEVIVKEDLLIAKEIDTTNSIKNEVQDFASLEPIKLNNAISPQNIPNEETLTVKSFFLQKVNQVLFGKKDPDEDEKYASVSQRVSSATGISFDLKRRKSRSNKEFYLKIGKFSIDRKKSN